MKEFLQLRLTRNDPWGSPECVDKIKIHHRMILMIMLHDHIMTWKTISAWWALCEGNLAVSGSPHKGSVVMQVIYVIFVGDLNKLLNKQLSWWWFELSWHWCDIMVMCRCQLSHREHKERGHLLPVHTYTTHTCQTSAYIRGKIYIMV